MSKDIEKLLKDLRKAKGGVSFLDGSIELPYWAIASAIETFLKGKLS